MKQGAELYKWAQEKARAAAGKDTGLLSGADWAHISLAIAEAYVQGGIDALADEVERKRAKLPKSPETIGL